MSECNSSVEHAYSWEGQIKHSYSACIIELYTMSFSQGFSSQVLKQQSSFNSAVSLIITVTAIHA